MNESGILKITETTKREIQAISARLYVSVSGNNFIYGNAAIEKCEEVRRLVNELKSVSVADKNIVVISVSAKIQSGLLSKSSHAVYSLRIDVEELKLLSEIVAVVSNQKNVSLDSLEWVFDEQEELMKLSADAMERAKRRAETMTSAVGYKVIGIKFCSDSQISSSDHTIGIQSEEAMMYRRPSMSSQKMAGDIGTEFKGTKSLSVTVVVEFVIKPELEK
jgi:uncharacterized protein YggE